MELKEKILFDFEDDNDFSNSFESTTSPSEKMFVNKNRNVYLQCLAGVFLLATPSESNAFADKIISNTTNIEVVENLSSSSIINKPMSFYLDEVNSLCLGVKQNKYDIIKDILSFKSLNNNWDGFGAIPLEIQSATNVMALIDLVGENEFCKVSEVFPNPNGTVSLIWINNSEETVSLDVGNNSMSYYIDLMSKETLYFDKIEINQIEAKKLAEFIRYL